MLAGGYTLVAIYGSFTPFEKVTPDPDVLREYLRRLPWLTSERPSPSDVAANVALFAPLGFFWAAATLIQGSTRTRLLRSGVLIGAAASLSILIELAQLWFPARTVSQYDIVAETVGAALGVLLWWGVGKPLSIWLAMRQPASSSERWRDWALQGYFVIATLLWLLPLDLTIRPRELVQKFREDRVVINPFSESTPERLLDVGLFVLLFLPVGFWLATTHTTDSQRVRSERACRWLVLGLGVMLAIGQLIVFSRRTDVVEIAAMVIGMSCGVSLAHYLGNSAALGGVWPAMRRSLARGWRLIAGLDEEPLPGGVRALRVGFYLAVLGATAWVLWQANNATPGERGFSGWQFPKWEPTWIFQAYWAIGLLCLLLVPRFPVWVLVVFGTFGYGVVPRVNVVAQFSRGLGLLELVAILGIVGVAIAQWGRPIGDTRWRWLPWLAIAYAAWGLLSAGLAHVEGRAWNVEVAKQCVRLVDSAAIMWVAAHVYATRRAEGMLTFFLVVSVALCGALYSGVMYRDHITATVAAIVLPLAAQGVFQSSHLAVKAVFGLASLRLLSILYAGESRSAVAGAVLGLSVWVLLSRYRWMLLATAIPGFVVSRVFLYNTPVWKRFEAIVSQEKGWDTGRLRLWEYGWEAFHKYPVFGEGPETGPDYLSDIHSSYLEALSETGAVGFSLYVLVWIGTLLMLGWIIWKKGDEWPGASAKALMGATAAQLAVGVGYSLHAYQLAFLLAGWGVALAAVVASESDDDVGHR